MNTNVSKEYTAFIFNPEDGGIIFIQNGGTHTCCHDPEDHHIYFHCRKNLRSRNGGECCLELNCNSYSHNLV